MVQLNLINGIVDLECNTLGEKVIVKDYDIGQGDTVPPEAKKDERGYYIEIVF